MAKKELVVAAYNSGVSAADVDYLCDGTADEVQINQAISALDVNGTVRLLNGTYNLSQRVRLNREAITLVGSGYTRLVRRYATPDLTNGIVTVSASNCTVKDIYINVEYDTTTIANVIGVYSNQNYTKISNVIVVGYETDKIENMYGIYLEGEKSFVEKCRITELYSTQKTRGIYCTGSDCVLQDNLITGAYGGAGVDYIYVSGSNSIIENNQCIGDSFNKIQSTARGIFVQATQCSICANVCKDVVSVEGLAEGINILGEGHVVNANVCRNNYAQSSTKYGMNIYVEADNCSITANTCYRNTNSKIFSNIFVDGNKNVVASNQATIGTGAASDYTAQQSNIFLNSGTNNLIIGNLILGKDVVDENTSTTAVNLIANNKYSPSQAYDPSGISEAPSDGKQYGRKNGAWDEIIKGLPVITMEQADAITDRGVYQVNYETTEEHGDYGDEPQYNTAILVADYYIGGGEKYYRQTLYGPLGKIRRRERLEYFSWQESYAEWMDVGYIYDAPKNTTAYARKNGGWSALSAVASSGSYNDLTAKPTSMKNPNAITFTGAATGIYDGSSALTVNIPSGGSGKKYCKFVIGSSAAGYTAADVDYLCDGTADEVQINAAIAAMPAGGGKVILLDGTYHLANTVTMNKDKVTLCGNGKNTILVREFPYPHMINVSKSGCCIEQLYLFCEYEFSNQKCCQIYSTGNELRIQNISMHGSSGGSSPSEGILLDGTYGNIVQGNELYSGEYTTSYCVKAVNCRFSIFNGNRISVGGAYEDIYGLLLDGGEYNTVTGNYFNAGTNDKGGTALRIDASDNTVSGNTLISSGHDDSFGIYVSGDRNTITGNTIPFPQVSATNNKGYGIYVTGSKNLLGNNVITTKNSTPAANQRSIYLSSAASYNLVTANNIYGKNVENNGTSNQVTNNLV